MAIALGSNLGDRMGHLREAVARLENEIRIGAVSSVYESVAEGVGDQPDFLNAVVTGEVRLAPHALLDVCRSIEERAGRERPFRHAPRTLDLDLVLFGELRLADGRLTIPHPRFRERAFVLAPLAEVAPRWMDPETGRAVEEIWEERRDRLPPVRKARGPETLRRRAQ